MGQSNGEGAGEEPRRRPQQGANVDVRVPTSSRGMPHMHCCIIHEMLATNLKLALRKSVGYAQRCRAAHAGISANPLQGTSLNDYMNKPGSFDSMSLRTIFGVEPRGTISSVFYFFCPFIMNQSITNAPGPEYGNYFGR